MKTFGETEILWRGTVAGGVNDDHVIVAIKGSGWDFLCRGDPRKYETVEAVPKPTNIPVVWKHDRSKVTCRDCAAELDKLDPGFKPSDVVLTASFPPLVGTMGRCETEIAAALLVRACQFHGDAWQSVSSLQVGEVVKADLAEKREPICGIDRNPFIHPDPDDLVARGYAEWAGNPTHTARDVLQFTSKGFASLKKWVRS